MHRARAAGLLTATALTIAALTACGGESEPDPSISTASPIDRATGGLTESATSPATSSGTDDTIDLPAAAKEHTKSGAIAFNVFYWDEAGEALTTGNPYVLETYADGCAVCDNMAERVRRNKSQDVRANTNPYSVNNTSATKRSDKGFRVELTLNIAPYHDVHPDGSKGSSYTSQAITVVSDTQWVDGAWEIHDQVRTK